uniref:Uncharacterized protein n=1 Tax=Electrophorus electricus TaxID=8005 RepID=A0A4W4GBY6_ELEEL
MGCKEITEDCLTMYLESKPPTNQFLCRAYLCQAQLKSPQTDDLDKAVMYYLKAIEVSKDKPGYHFLVFNASLLYFQSVRAFLRPGWRRHLVSSLTEVLRALEVVQESDYAWRSELMLCVLLNRSFILNMFTEVMQRVNTVVITPPSLSPVTLFITFFLDIPRFGHHSRSPIGCMYYAQLSVLCLMECVCIQAQLAAVGRLDALLQRAVKEGDGQVIQCVCAALWNSCLPLLQPNLRRSIKRALLTLAHALEAINSMLLGVRCPVHAELAGIEEEEERLEPALRHLHKALALDERAQHQQRLSFSLHLLQLRASLHGAPARQEDQAARLIEQVSPPARKWRPMLVSAGIALAPVTFQMALNAEHPAKVSGSRLHVEELAAKAQHHLACEDEVKGHLASLDRGTDDRERLWASLVKVARRQEVWDVCRAACRFCLLYDDGRWKNNCDNYPIYHFTAHFVLSDYTHKGVELNGSPVPPVVRGACPPEVDPQWTVYRYIDWIQNMSAYATANFLRGAELGAELQEEWLVANAAVYLWNYNSHMLATGGQRILMPTFCRLVELLRQTGKGLEKLCSTHGIPLEAAAVQDIKKALELCDYALRLSNGNGERVPIMVRKQVISSWVRTKRLLQQQIGPKLDTDDQSQNKAVAAMSRVLVGVEMVLCNSSPMLLEFTVPSLATLVRMASDCKWPDPVAALYVWSQLAHFAHQIPDHDLIMTCTQNALQLEHAAIHSAKVTVCTLAVLEMLSSATCLRGLSMLHQCSGHPASYTGALGMLQSSIRSVYQAHLVQRTTYVLSYVSS